jgi:hypothetical protein
VGAAGFFIGSGAENIMSASNVVFIILLEAKEVLMSSM